MSIARKFQYYKDRFLRHRLKLLILAIIFLSSTISFALGYLMTNDQNRAPIIIEKAE